jgi:GNAT superfamily N-acetyltransferase
MRQNPYNVVEADLAREDHQDSTVLLVNAYAMDPMGGGQSLSDAARRELITGLRQHPTTMVLLAYAGPAPVGIAVCFRGFSTFAARPLMNIHDFFVVPNLRGAGIGRALLSAVEERARTSGCCKLTLEVKAKNVRALRVYYAWGFNQPDSGRENDGVLFMTKPL